MRGQFLSAWEYAISDIFEPLLTIEDCPSDLACQLFDNVPEELKRDEVLWLVLDDSLTVNEDGRIDKRDIDGKIAQTGNDPVQAKRVFYRIVSELIETEPQALNLLKGSYQTCDEIIYSSLEQNFERLVRGFIKKYNLNYYLSPKFRLCLDLYGIQNFLVQTIVEIANGDSNVRRQLDDLAHALMVCQIEAKSGNIATCINRYCLLLEAVAVSHHPAMSGQTLSQYISTSIHWPHHALRNAARNFYGFASDYPGIRHGGNPDSALRELDHRDLLSATTLMSGFSVYLYDTNIGESIVNGGQK